VLDLLVFLLYILRVESDQPWFFYQVGLSQSLCKSSSPIFPLLFPHFPTQFEITRFEKSDLEKSHIWDVPCEIGQFWPTQLLIQVESIQPYSFFKQIGLNRINSNSCFNRIGVETAHSSVLCPTIGLSRPNQFFFTTIWIVPAQPDFSVLKIYLKLSQKATPLLTPTTDLGLSIRVCTFECVRLVTGTSSKKNWLVSWPIRVQAEGIPRVCQCDPPDQPPHP